MRMLTPYWSARNLTTDFLDEVDRIFDQVVQTPLAKVYDERSFEPVCEIAETEDNYLMSVDLPGLKKDDIKIEVIDNVLTVSGERKRESSAGKTQKIQRYERSYGFFKRSFNLPASIDADKVEARYENGVLELNLPKTPAAKPRQIEIHSG